MYSAERDERHTLKHHHKRVNCVLFGTMVYSVKSIKMKGKEEKEEITLYAQYKSVFNIQYRLFLLQHQEALVFRYYYYYNIAFLLY